MPPSSSVVRHLAISLIAAAATLSLVAGCSSQSADDKSEKTESSADELRLSGTRYLGRITSGQTRTGYYYTPPTYRSYGFDARGGDKITADVKSVYGDGVGYITDATYNVLAFNDDATQSTLDSKVTYTIPAGQPIASYRIVFRDYDLLEATFSVKLSIESTAVPVCTYDGQSYSAGEQFESIDGCNTCTCSANGSVSCSKMVCACNPQQEPWRTYLGTPAQCPGLVYTCTAPQVSFQNNCGCGCEDPNH
jgi:hypothetical protein